MSDDNSLTGSPVLSLRSQISREFIPPENETEKTIAAIWASVLGFDQVGIMDDFFSDLGGSSIQILSVFEKILTKSGEVELPIEIFFGEQTVKKQADFFTVDGRFLDA